VAVVDDVPEACVVVVVDEGVLGDTVDDADVGGCTVVVGVSIESAAPDDVGVVVGPLGAGTDVAAEGMVVSAAGWLLSDVVGRPDAVVVADFPALPDVVVVGALVALVVGVECVVAVDVGGSVVAVVAVDVGGSVVAVVGGSVVGGGLTCRRTGVPGATQEPPAGR